MELSERGCEILKIIVQAYIRDAEPVGSRSVSRNSGMGLSPATIRNAMADLEDVGLLFQPHTSAGRLPTEAGLRYYVDNLLKKESLSWGDQLAIEKDLLSGTEDLKSTLKRAADILAHFSGHAAVVSAPKLTSECVRHIEFVRVRPGVILVITVSDAGLVQNRLIQTDADYDEKKLETLSWYLNSRLPDMGLEEAKEALVKELEKEKEILDRLMEDFLSLKRPREQDGDVYIGGQLNLFDQPEFSNISKLRVLLQTFEEKALLVSLLERCLDATGVQIFVGTEGFGEDVPDCGLVMAPYANHEHPVGSIGVVGPMRMNYARVMALVEYIAEILGERMKE